MNRGTRFRVAPVHRGDSAGSRRRRLHDHQHDRHRGDRRNAESHPDHYAAEQPSAILVQPIHDAQVVPGDDGKDHVEYELMVVNVYFDPVTLTSLTVLDPAGKELGRITAPPSPLRPRRS